MRQETILLILQLLVVLPLGAILAAVAMELLGGLILILIHLLLIKVPNLQRLLVGSLETET